MYLLCRKFDCRYIVEVFNAANKFSYLAIFLPGQSTGALWSYMQVTDGSYLFVHLLVHLLPVIYSFLQGMLLLYIWLPIQPVRWRDPEGRLKSTGV